MKRILFLFTASLLLLACSNDDNGPDGPQELKIKKFTSIMMDANGTPTGNSTEYFFDANGTFTQKKDLENNFTRITDYSYNELGQKSESKIHYIEVNEYVIVQYFYDSEKRLDYMTDSDNGETPQLLYQFTYRPNEVRITPRTPYSYRVLKYNDDILKSINSYVEPGYGVQLITYDAANNIIDRTYRNGTSNELHSTLVYQYDDKINPLYPYFNEFPFNLMDEYGFILELFDQFFSPNNFTSEVYTSINQPEYNFTIMKTFQYNEDGYPISAVVKKNDVIIEELTYEYY